MSLCVKKSTVLSFLKGTVISPENRTLPRSKRQNTVHTDDCLKGIWRVVFLVKEDRSNCLVGYWSGTLNDKDEKLTTTQMEYLAVAWVVTLSRPYLKGSALRSGQIPTMAEATGKMERWGLRLSEFELHIVHCAGIKHQVADTLSRLKENDEGKTPLDDEAPILTIPQDIFAGVPKTEIPDLEFIEEVKGPFFLFIPEVCMMAGPADNEKQKVSTLSKFIPAQITAPPLRPLQTLALVSTSIATKCLFQFPL